jgi:FtsP/CotA-like multicopper oxidase with cupredoxin domain
MSMIRGLVLALCIGLIVPVQALAQQTGGDCPRPAPGAIVTPPADLYSVNGVLQVAMNYYTSVDAFNRTEFCFVTAAGQEGPTFHVNPGDKLEITLTDMVPNPPGVGGEIVSSTDSGSGPSSGLSPQCFANAMTPASVNMHFHGTNTSPTCHSDEVIYTTINSGETFQYTIQIPTDEPPGLYWYHPHVHGIASPAVQGGATGVIEVEGIANLQPIVAGLPERYLVIRDQHVAHNLSLPDQPFWDISLNYVPINFPNYEPAIIQMNPGTQEFWRVANTDADTVMDLKLTYDGVAQPLTLVALDGVPIGSQDGKHQGSTLTQTDVYIPVAGRAEFIVNGPTSAVKSAILSTNRIDTGPAGDNDPPRPLASIQLTDKDLKLPLTQERTGPPNPQRFSDLDKAKVTATRSLYFTEGYTESPSHAPSGLGFKFFITVKGQEPQVFAANEPPKVRTHQGAVEDWTIENHTTEVHEFHMHQIHFLLLAVNGVPVKKAQQQFYDTYQVGYWKGKGKFPSITVRMDFRGAVVGDFVYHCHILDHEDAGMMAKIQVAPAP